MIDRLDPAWRPLVLAVVPVYLLAQVYLIARGELLSVALMLANTLFLALLMWLTARVTRPLPPPVAPRQSPGLIWAQLGVLGVIMVLTALQPQGLPLWSSLVARLRAAGEAALPVEWFGGPGNALANPVMYFVIPLLLLLALGARPGELGLGRGHRVARASLVWLAGPGLLLLMAAPFGAITAQAFVRRVISNFFQNGFFEEFLFRGALQTRLGRFLTPPWALVVQAFLFGLWHIQSNLAAFDGDLLAALAWCIVSQGVLGLAFGFVFQRTRNLVAPTVAHVMINVMGQTFS